MIEKDEHEGCKNLCYEVRRILIPLVAEIAAHSLRGPSPHRDHYAWLDKLIGALRHLEDI